jgi:hypothetical protein
MKSLQITALALLLSNPAVHTGCDGYEDFMSRNLNLSMCITTTIAGGSAILYGVKKIWSASNQLDRLTNNDASDTLLLSARSSRENIENISENLSTAGCIILVGVAMMAASMGTMISNESGARSNCCNALPSNSTCSWK